MFKLIFELFIECLEALLKPFNMRVDVSASGLGSG
jgi:hypothetical protein